MRMSLGGPYLEGNIVMNMLDAWYVRCCFGMDWHHMPSFFYIPDVDLVLDVIACRLALIIQTNLSLVTRFGNACWA